MKKIRLIEHISPIMEGVSTHNLVTVVDGIIVSDVQFEQDEHNSAEPPYFIDDFVGEAYNPEFYGEEQNDS